MQHLDKLIWNCLNDLFFGCSASPVSKAYSFQKWDISAVKHGIIAEASARAYRSMFGIGHSLFKRRLPAVNNKTCKQILLKQCIRLNNICDLRQRDVTLNLCFVQICGKYRLPICAVYNYFINSWIPAEIYYPAVLWWVQPHWAWRHSQFNWLRL